MTEVETPQWDAFISYASEDREDVARPLAEALRAIGLRIWYDQSELRLGDSLRERVDHGLASSRFGIVVLSPAFFAKHYPVRELNGLAQREIGGEKVLLPIWHGVTDQEVRRFSPPLADRIAARWEEGLDSVVAKLFEIVGERVIREIKEAAAMIHDLPELTTGNQLIAALQGAHAHVFVHDEFRSEAEAGMVGDFLQELEDWIDILDEIGAGERARVEFSLTGELRNLRTAGWKVFGDNVLESIGYGVPGKWPVACVAVVHEDRHAAARIGEQIVSYRKTDGDVKPPMVDSSAGNDG